MEAALGIYAGSVIVAAASALIPVINAEIYLGGVVLAAGATIPQAILLGFLVAFGQMIGKSVVYSAAKGSTKLGAKRLDRTITRARALIAKWGDRPQLVMFLSATASLPPYLLVAAFAGLLEIPFRRFYAIGLAGRSLRFVTIAVVAALV